MGLLAARVFTEDRGTLLSRYSSSGVAHPITITPDPRDFPDLDYDFSTGRMSQTDVRLIHRWRQVERMDAVQAKYRRAREFCQMMRDIGGREVTVRISPRTEPALELTVPTTGQGVSIDAAGHRKARTSLHGEKADDRSLALSRSLSISASPPELEARGLNAGVNAASTSLFGDEHNLPSSVPTNSPVTAAARRLRTPVEERHVASFSFVPDGEAMNIYCLPSRFPRFSAGLASASASGASVDPRIKNANAVSYDDIINEIEEQNRSYEQWRFSGRWDQ